MIITHVTVISRLTQLNSISDILVSTISHRHKSDLPLRLDWLFHWILQLDELLMPVERGIIAGQVIKIQTLVVSKRFILTQLICLFSGCRWVRNSKNDPPSTLFGGTVLFHYVPFSPLRHRENNIKWRTSSFSGTHNRTVITCHCRWQMPIKARHGDRIKWVSHIWKRCAPVTAYDPDLTLDQIMKYH